jgi:hypothetical protein
MTTKFKYALCGFCVAALVLAVYLLGSRNRSPDPNSPYKENVSTSPGVNSPQEINLNQPKK